MQSQWRWLQKQMIILDSLCPNQNAVGNVLCGIQRVRRAVCVNRAQLRSGFANALYRSTSVATGFTLFIGHFIYHVKYRREAIT